MIALLLAAGYATRMYPLTKDFPKPLLPVKGKPILDYVLDDLNQIPDIDRILIVSNHKFIRVFVEWLAKRPYDPKIVLLDDGSTTNENRLGAVRELTFVFQKEQVTDDILVLAGDNLYDFSMQGFLDFYKSHPTTLIMTHEEPSVEALKKTGVAVLEGSQVIEFAEKPATPKSHHAVPPFYIYPQSVFPRFQQYLDEGNVSDAPGSFIAWLVSKEPVHAYPMPGKRIDIGDLATYEAMK
jgi:glucose-1-phosphate thymidylyltransferase